MRKRNMKDAMHVRRLPSAGERERERDEGAHVGLEIWNEWDMFGYREWLVIKWRAGGIMRVVGSMMMMMRE